MVIYKYGLKYDVPRIGFLPSKAIIDICKDKSKLTEAGIQRGECYHGILTYGRKLSLSECNKYGLDYFGEDEI